MALTVGAQFGVDSANVDDPLVVPYDTDKALCIFSDNDDDELAARTLDVSSGTTMTIGGSNQIIPDSGVGADAKQIETGKVILVYDDDDDGSKGKIRVLSVSGTTVTAHTAADFDTNALESTGSRVCMLTSGTGLIAYRRDMGATTDMWINTFSVGGTSVTPGTGTLHQDGDSPFHSFPACLERLTNTKGILLYYSLALPTMRAQIIDNTGAEGTPLVLDGGDTATRNAVARLTDTSAIVVYTTSSTIKARILSISGTTITAGTALTISTGGSTGLASVVAISPTQALIIYQDSTAPNKVVTLTISGTTVTNDGGAVNALTGGASSGPFLCLVAPDMAIASNELASNNTPRANYISFPAPSCAASFYYGIENPVFTSSLPFCVNPGGLAISATNIMAVLGTAGPAGRSVVYGQAPYVTWNDISGIVPTGTAVTSIKFI